MKRQRKAFTLVELLVVIGIIAVLIAILLPSLTRARQQAQTVQCMSNLRQLYTAVQMYATHYKGYVLPSRVMSGQSSAETLWCARDVLAPMFGIKGDNGQEVTNRLAKYLDCPSNLRDKHTGTGGGTVISVDYTYNASMGDDRAHPFSPGYNPSYAPTFLFKKTNQVPQNVIIAMDASEFATKNYERFGDIGDVTYDGLPKPYSSWVHNNKTNVLFMDGVVRTISLWKNEKNPPTYPQKKTIEDVHPLVRGPDANGVEGKGSGNWMILARDWDKGRPIPF